MSAPAASSLRVLIVDDDPDVLNLSLRLVRKAAPDAHVTTAIGGAAAVAQLSKTSGLGAGGELLPEIILLDLHMPDLNGFDVLRWVRRNGALAAAKVVMLSSSMSRTDIERAEELGADGYLIKFPSVQDLMALFAGANGRSLWPPT